MDQVDPPCNQFRFVGLEVPDEVPSDSFTPQLRAFAEELLYVVLADILKPGPNSLLNKLCRKCLRNANKRDFPGIPACARAGLSYSVPDTGYVLGDH